MEAQTQITHSEQRPAGVPEVALQMNGQYYMEDADGSLTLLSAVRATDLLEDETVRRIMGFAAPLSDRIQRFKQHTLEDVSSLLSVIDQEHGVKKGGRKGNVTLTSYDGRMMVQLAIADQLTFGPELQSAKQLVDECLIEWSGAEGTRPELQAIVQKAFNTDRAGLVNRSELFGLLRLDIEDERWQRAMKAIKDSIRILGTKEYVRFYKRENARAAWKAVTINVAAA